MRKRLVQAAIAAALPLHAAWAATSYAPSDLGGSPIPVGAGTRALAMGGAFVAIADDASAATWNPAGMTQLERPEASASGGWYWRRAAFPGGSRGETATDLDHAALVLPFMAGLPQTLGIQWQRQFDFTKGQALATNEATDLGGGFTQTDTSRVALAQSGAFASLGLSYAVEVAPRLSFGVTGQAWGDRLTWRGAYHQTFTRHSESVFTDNTGAVLGDETNDFTSDESVVLERGYSAVVGAHWQPTSRLSLGATWKPSYLLHLSHHVQENQVTTDLIAGTSSQNSDSSDFRSELRYPTSVALGAAWRLDDERTVACDVAWTRWRQYRSITGAGAASPVNPFVAPDDYPDGYSVRLGYEHIVILPRLVVVPRIGALWESVPGSTPAASTLRPATAGARLDRYYGATAGVGVFQERVLYELAAQYRFADHVVGEGSAPDETSRVRAAVVRAGIAVQF